MAPHGPPLRLVPGIVMNTLPTDYRPIKQLQITRFNGERCFGPIIVDDLNG
jgi:branched-chain amino acid transport system substrate-binding protein